MAQTWWLIKLVDLDMDGILHPIQQGVLEHQKLPYLLYVTKNVC